MAIKEITQSTLDQIKTSEFTVLFFYAKGCHHCEAAKPTFERLSEEYLGIQFLKAEFSELRDHYDLFAEEIQEVRYESDVDSNMGVVAMVPVPQVNEDGTPKMVKKYSFPSFYVYHTKNTSESNPYGFIGAFDGNNPQEAEAVVSQLNAILLGIA